MAEFIADGAKNTYTKPWEQIRTWVVSRNMGWLNLCQSSSGKALGMVEEGAEEV